MFLHIPDVLSPEQVADLRHLLVTAPWVDASGAVGDLSAAACLHLDDHDPLSWRLGDRIADALGRSALFTAAALPLRLFPPIFERDRGAPASAPIVDEAVRTLPGSPLRMRADLSGVIFLSDPEDYDEGELVIMDAFGTYAAKERAGHVVLFPAVVEHAMRPVTRGVRLAARFWVQSLIRDREPRDLLLDLDTTIKRLTASGADAEAIAQLGHLYQRLVRRWAEL
ncbi:MAG TPA: Fe2+-dependent dioxygenase [Vicinamibacterales bacterium]|nr:Fe2+-dependent dioxygenase [Vicinamibacterales bacterium]